MYYNNDRNVGKTSFNKFFSNKKNGVFSECSFL